jgi:hypothetical protein
VFDFQCAVQAINGLLAKLRFRGGCRGAMAAAGSSAAGNPNKKAGARPAFSISEAC